MIRFHHLLLRLMLVLALLGGQLAGLAHGYSHVPASWQTAAAAESQASVPGEDQRSLGHACLECLAFSALDTALTAGDLVLSLANLGQTPLVALPSGRLPLAQVHFRSRAPPQIL